MIKKCTVYSTPACHYCHSLKSWLKENSIPFEEKDVASDMKARQEMVEKSHQMGVPVSILEIKSNNGTVKEEIVIGFDQRRLSQLLGL